MLKILPGAVVRETLDMTMAIELVRKAMIATSRPGSVQPTRWMVDLPTADHAVLGLMPGLLPDEPLFGAKVTAVYPENHQIGLASHQSLILLFDKAHGVPTALIDGAEITGTRTAAASAVATDQLARADASILAVLGYGVQAERHIEAIMQVRPIRSLRLWGRKKDRAEHLADRIARRWSLDIEVAPDAKSAVDGAHIVCTVTAAREPILLADWVSPGAHVNIVGSSSADAIEVDPLLLARARLFVDAMPAAMSLGGDIIAAIDRGLFCRDDIAGEIGAVLDGRELGRRSEDEITAYKSVGIPAQDIVCANHVVAEARQRELGETVQW
ncbi:MAG: ornithine cyclodeaminase family protein [Sphingomonadales bacterium]|nr:ornithine cyclodeaminase family protein [Sphingomonadales bacterium]